MNSVPPFPTLRSGCRGALSPCGAYGRTKIPGRQLLRLAGVAGEGRLDAVDDHRLVELLPQQRLEDVGRKLAIEAQGDMRREEEPRRGGAQPTHLQSLVER